MFETPSLEQILLKFMNRTPKVLVCIPIFLTDTALSENGLSTLKWPFEEGKSLINHEQMRYCTLLSLTRQIFQCLMLWMEEILHHFERLKPYI